ncbi:hypothetical protein ABW20_dc0108919 [Dactylellina cionopaga]|nr:hypothetical protein ABW20_dc0108919 [Dactylellina cionopaga]
MRNLLSTRRRCYPLTSSVAPDLPLAATAWDPSSNSIICAFGPASDFPVIEISRIENGLATNITSWDYQGPCPREGMEVDTILSLHYFADDLSICLVLGGGDVIIVREERAREESKVEIVGSVEGGITAASWSPDEGLLAIATSSQTFVLMTRQFEPVTDMKLTDEDLKLSKHVNVGWGKKETQFKGKRAASLRDPTMPEKTEDGNLSTCDTHDTKLSWRGDGQYVALSTIQSEKRRVVRVFSRNGGLDGASEPVDGMEAALSWQPSGSLIASTRRLGDNLDVIFFERNGLRHGEFPLRIPPAAAKNHRIHDLSWNVDSTVLAVCLQDRVQLWTTMNYHWYLKSEIRNEKIHNQPSNNSPPRIRWHPEKSLHLHMTANGKYFIYFFSSLIQSQLNRSNSFDFGIVAVIDGSNLKLTPFRFANVPPPMSHRDIELDSNIIDVAVSPLGENIMVLTTNYISMVAWDILGLGRKASLQSPAEIIKLDDTLHYRQSCFFGTGKIALLHGDSSVEVYKLLESSWMSFGKIQDSQLLNGVVSIRPSGDNINLLCENLSGDVLVFDEKLTVIGKIGFPEPCLIQERYRAHENTRIIIGLTENGRLFADGILIMSGCTSFVLTDSHIIVTTKQNLLKFIPINTEFQVPPDDATNGDQCRSVERGSKLVTVIPSTFSVLLQMPRGNLETIYPRALVLTGIRNSIDSKDYKTAFAYCRTHRVDFNFLHDHNPEQFMASIDIFLEQVGNVQFVDLFLSQLRDDDVSKTMYDICLSDSTMVEKEGKTHHSSQIPEKVNKICDAIREGIQRRPYPSTQNLVTCYVSKKPADLDRGLLMISDLRMKDAEDAELAIEHICFLADANKLYEHALGIYDLDLALIIAQQSQKDPREYLPFLQSIREMEPLRQNFFLDDFLGRFAKAITWLHEMGDSNFLELSEYTVKHSLYRQTTDLVKYDDEKRIILIKLHAEYLMTTSNYREAGLSFEYLGSWERALDAYKKCGMWQETLYAASRIPLSSEEIMELAEVLAEALAESKDFGNAAKIHLDYRNDVKEAVASLCRGSLFQEAMRVIALNQMYSLLEEVVDPGLIDSFNTISELITDFLGQIKSQTARIKALHEKKENDPLSFYGATGETDVPDNVSVAGTEMSTAAGSIFTRYTDKTSGTLGTSATRRTSKNKRREERKKARGKKGSIYEEEYLITSIGRLIVRLNEAQEESYRLIEGLMRRGMRERALSIQAGIQSVLSTLEKSRTELFESTSTTPFDLMADDKQEDNVVISASKLPDFSAIKPFNTLSIL